MVACRDEKEALMRAIGRRRPRYQPMWRQQANKTLVRGFGYCLRFVQTTDAWAGPGAWYQYIGIHRFGPVPAYGPHVKVPKRRVWGLRVYYGKGIKLRLSAEGRG
jgi:phage gpG-like protein